MSKRYLKECFVESIYHYDALSVWNKLKTHSENNCQLSFYYDPNKYKDNKIKVELKEDDSKSPTIIGELNVDDSKIIIDVVSQGYTDVFSAIIIQKKDDVTDENKKIKVVVYVNECPKSQGCMSTNDSQPNN